MAAAALTGGVLAFASVATGIGSVQATGAVGGSCPTSIGGLNLSTVTLPELRAGLDARRFTSRQLVDSYLARLGALNRKGPRLRPVIRVNPDARNQANAADAALAQDKSFGPLMGIPVLLKDNLDTRGLPTTAGAKALRGSPPPRDAFLVARLRQAGAIVLGKANLDELATKISPRQPHGFSDVGGQTRNPYTLGDPSGSSNGSAVAASAGLAGSTVGTETSGSIIDPATVNSAVGLKPTRGLVSRGGVVPLLEQYDTPGPIDQNVTDAAVMLGLMTGVDPRDRATRRQVGHAKADYTQFLDPTALEGARIGVVKTSDKDPLVEIPGLAGIKRTLENEGATVIQLDDELIVEPVATDDFLDQFRRQLTAYLRGRGPTSPKRSMVQIVRFNKRLGRRAVRYGQRFLVQAVGLPPRARRGSAARVAAVREQARETMRAAFAGDDLDAIILSRGISAITNTPAGYPAVTVPAGYRGRRPYGAIFAGPPWSEPELIGYAYAFEQATRAWRSPAEFTARFAAACAS